MNGKQRVSRIPLDYFERPDRMVRVKRFFVVLLLLGAVAWLGSLLFASARGNLGLKRYSHGPVSAVHAPLEQECSACHVDFGAFADHHSPDRKCQDCHLQGDLATHSADQKAGMTPNCGNCHSDHHGRDFSLRRVADGQCTECHKDLKESLTSPGAARRYANSITAFAKDHPSFKAPAVDPGKLKFNHKYHMNAGIVLTQGGKPFTLADIPESMRERYRGTDQRKGAKPDSEYAVQMTCAMCHQPESRDELRRDAVLPEPYTDPANKTTIQKYFADRQERRGRLPSGELAPPHRVGAFMAPISYDQHCAACHTLNLDDKITGLPHKLQPEEMVTVLEERLRGSPQAMNTGGPRPVNLPGKKGVAGRLPDERLDAGLRVLFEGKRMCAECHQAEGGGELFLPLRKAGESLGDYAKRFPKVARPDVPELWFKHARFNHDLHRDMNCVECHKEAGAGSDAAVWADYNKPRKGAEAVMLPAIDICRQCHSPNPDPKQVERNLAAKHDCTECHGYHHGKGPPRP